ncbi:MAG: Eco57I restriction-modification methylase domain-containing protein [Bacteroidales bacterium]|nr:Eco57I restriction-modification methylase domain-containing protein [Bacteroidales bacterium]
MPYNGRTYREVILEQLLHAQRLLAEPELLEPYDNGDRLYGLGYLTDSEGKEIGLYYTHIAHGDVRRKRVGFRRLLAPYIKYGADAAIAVFDDGVHWRLSYICDLKGGITSAKRFSYVFGDPKGQYNTPVGRLTDLAQKRLTLAELYKTFSVDALSKEFFDEYHRQYDRICDHIIRSHINTLTQLHIHDYVKKLMGRIVFLHFLQKKRWLNDDPEFLKNLFFMQPPDRRADFLEQVLEPLFFGIFNTEVANREQVFRENGWDLSLLKQWNGGDSNALPYLNGGLFERDEVDKMHIVIPASLFENLFEFMASYNFTVDENDPDDAEVGVDPEMLGKIFESLLEDNKAKGAFYTPKEIVRYMCRESLIAYLDSKLAVANASEKQNAQSANNPIQESAQFSQCGDAGDKGKCVSETRDLKTAIRAFVEQHEMQPELGSYREVIDTALRNVKICDPAIGSGAFPMGLLNELWRCREALMDTEDTSEGCDFNNTVRRAVTPTESPLRAGGMRLKTRAELKREIIENNIYGVDIERGAIDIARLRFWLSIVVDAEYNANPGSGPEPLPNFDYKFMQGNSLIESYKGIDLSRISNRLRGGQSKSTQLLLGLDSDFSKKNLQRLMRDYFSVTDHKQKASMRQAINDEVKRLITDFIGGTAADLDTLDPSANQDFFLWHTWFKDIFANGGFDIVIGNPPYVNIANIKNDDYRELLKKSFRSTRNKCDLYAYFIEKAFKLTSDTGIVAYIVPITWKATDSFRKLREIIFKEHSILQIVNLNYGTFDATVKPMILLMTSRFRKDYIIEIFREDFNPLYEICSQEVISTSDLSIDTESDLTDKELLKSIEKDCITLGNIIKFSRGIKTSNDKRFVGFQHLSNEYKKVFRGRNIRPYSLEWMGEYIWYRPDLMKEKAGCLPHTKTFLKYQKSL